jgi:hypothetical protein
VDTDLTGRTWREVIREVGERVSSVVVVVVS